MTDRAFAYAQHARLVELGMAQPVRKEAKAEESKEQDKEGENDGTKDL
jgi:hypothetical protein